MIILTCHLTDVRDRPMHNLYTLCLVLTYCLLFVFSCGYPPFFKIFLNLNTDLFLTRGKGKVLGHKHRWLLKGIVGRVFCSEVLVCVECAQDTVLTWDKQIAYWDTAYGDKTALGSAGSQASCVLITGKSQATKCSICKSKHIYALGTHSKQDTVAKDT